ncbi:MAG: transcription antitermination factor NusB [Deinococcus sp.]|nr:transcription antitermination factor NusB [Deinococcus sp.]MCL5964880.1 transcription antitermination factor NusB [Deinococcus sp.]
MRRKARELAFKVLFEHAVGGVDLEAAWQHALLELGEDPESASEELGDEGLTFARKLLDGYRSCEAAVDRVLSGTIEGWSFGQMAKTDLAILRLAAYEMLYERTPHAPLIEVAVKIAKRFGGEDSGRFVNGVLARLLKRLESGELKAVAKDD